MQHLGLVAVSKSESPEGKNGEGNKLMSEDNLGEIYFT